MKEVTQQLCRCGGQFGFQIPACLPLSRKMEGRFCRVKREVAWRVNSAIFNGNENAFFLTPSARLICFRYRGTRQPGGHAQKWRVNLDLDKDSIAYLLFKAYLSS